MPSKRQAPSFKHSSALPKGCSPQAQAYVHQRQAEVKGVRERWTQHLNSQKDVPFDAPDPPNVALEDGGHQGPLDAPPIDDAMLWEDEDHNRDLHAGDLADPMLTALQRAAYQARVLARENAWTQQLDAMFTAYLIAKVKTSNWAKSNWNHDFKPTCSCAGKNQGMRDVVLVDYESRLSPFDYQTTRSK